MDKKMMLRSLRGAPLSVLVSLFMFGGGDRQDLINWTGYGKGAVDGALRLLEDRDLVVRPSYRRWVLSDGFKQLGLFNYPIIGPSGSYPQLVDNVAESPKTGPSSVESPKIGPSAVVSSRSTKTNNEDRLEQTILDVCNEVGIYGRKRNELAALDHVVSAGPDYVRDHVSAAGGQMGLAIWRMERGWAVPGKRPSSSRAVVPDGYELVDGVLCAVDG